MIMKKHIPLIEIKHFIQAIRDAGYKGTASAIAELSIIPLKLMPARWALTLLKNNEHRVEMIKVSDNGSGMTPEEMKIAYSSWQYPIWIDQEHWTLRDGFAQ